MCGICGRINFNEDRPVDPRLIDAMTDAMTHRGPDDRGVYVENNVGLGMRRLSIIDLSGGHQPISNETGDIFIVLNGEIYNFQSLREELIGKGHVFKTRTDTETVLHLYEQFGEDCLRRLRGMFAFAIWDQKKKKLFIARDRAGKKPLVYAAGPGWLSFASEISALIKDPEINRDIDFESIDLYLAYQFIPHPWTIYKAVRKLPPAHYMVLENGRIRMERYWRLDLEKKVDVPEEEAEREVLRLLDEAVRLRMISDVPLGALLSGGLDSSAVVSLMSGASGRQVKTFSIGFEDEEFNELPYAREVARYCNTEHHELIVKPDIEGLIERLPAIYGEPFADNSAVPSYYLSKMTREHVVVALNGDGGDELFAGYKRYSLNAMGGFFERSPLPVRRIAGAALEGLASSVKAGRPMTKLMRNLLPHYHSLYYSEYFEPFRKKLLYNERAKAEISGLRLKGMMAEMERGSRRIKDPVDRMLFMDFNQYLPDDLLVKMDIASMANSLEVRSPFLDHELIEFCASLPSRFKVQKGARKYILKRSMEGKLPPDIINRQKKGFSMPVKNWLRTRLKDRAEEILFSSPVMKEYFSQDYLRTLFDEHTGRRKNHAHRLWTLLILGSWDLNCR